MSGSRGMVAFGLGAGLVALGAALFASERRELADFEPAQPINVRQPGAFREAPVMESSGVAISRERPGAFWTLNDSGNPASLFLADTTGTVLGFVSLEPGHDVDWEAISGAPCGPDWCLYVGDIGDNRSIRRSVVVYRLREPTRTALAARTAAPDDSLVIEYADGPHDAESLVATSDGDLLIITKGQNGRAVAYWIDGSVWGNGRAVARPVWGLPISTSFLFARLVTDAALSPDASTLAVRTYRELHLFRRAAGDSIPREPVGSCDVGPLDPQGEGVAWVDDSTVLMTSEITRFRPGPITLLQCPVR